MAYKKFLLHFLYKYILLIHIWFYHVWCDLEILAHNKNLNNEIRVRETVKHFVRFIPCLVFFYIRHDPIQISARFKIYAFPMHMFSAKSADTLEFEPRADSAAASRIEYASGSPRAKRLIKTKCKLSSRVLWMLSNEVIKKWRRCKGRTQTGKSLC